MAVNDDQLVERLVPKILSSIRAKAKPVESLNVKDSMDGITSMPCYDTTGEQFKAVLVPVDVLRSDSLEAASNANAAAEAANAAADRVNESILNIESEKESVRSLLEEIEQHPPRVNDSYMWEIWDAANDMYVNSNVYARGRSPIIVDGYWALWNDETDTFEPTDVNVYPKLSEMENDANYVVANDTDSESVKDAYLNGEKINFTTITDAVTMSDGKTLSEYVSSLESRNSFYEGHNNVTTMSGLPSTKRLVIATIGESQELSFSDTIADGHEVHIIVNNSGTADITLALPNTGSYVCLVDTAITVEAGAFVELNVISDGSLMYIRGI